VPDAVVPLLNANVQAPTAVTEPVMLLLTPAHTLLLMLLIRAEGRGLREIAVLPVNPATMAEQLASCKDEIENVVAAEGVVGMLKVPFPVPVVVTPLFKVNVHAPKAVTLPAILVVVPVQMLALAVVRAARGRGFTVTAVLPVKPTETALQFASVSDEMLYVAVAVGVTRREKVLFPVPVTVEPLLRVIDHAPVAVTLPERLA